MARENKCPGGKCATCGKELKISSFMDTGYVYRRVYKGRRKWFCGWNCMRAFDRKAESLKAPKKKPDKYEYCG